MHFKRFSKYYGETKYFLNNIGRDIFNEGKTSWKRLIISQQTCIQLLWTGDKTTQNTRENTRSWLEFNKSKLWNDQKEIKILPSLIFPVVGGKSGACKKKIRSRKEDEYET